jgi:hypothetical protein
MYKKIVITALLFSFILLPLSVWLPLKEGIKITFLRRLIGGLIINFCSLFVGIIWVRLFGNVFKTGGES